MSDAGFHTSAIESALNNNWKEAISINKAILKANDTDIDTLNRLAFAYLKNGQPSKAKTTYEKVIALDRYNTIATKNIKKLKNFKKSDGTRDCSSTLSAESFIEEPGVTKIIICIHLAPTSVLSTVSCGQEVILRVRRRCVEVRSLKNIYLGALPDDLSFRFVKLLSEGNTYKCLIKSITPASLTVFVREVSRSGCYKNQPSFLSSSLQNPSSPPKKVRLRSR